MTWRVLGAFGGACAIVAIVVVLLAPSNGNVIDPVATAADTTAAAGSAEFGLAGSMSVAGQTIPLNGSGAIDMRNHAMRVSVAMPFPGLGNTQIDEIFNGTTFYMHLPDTLTQRLPGAKPWMKIDLQALGKSAGIDFKKALQANQSNPADMLAALKGVGTSKKVGTENIDGAPTTHYTATIDLNKAAARIADKQTVDALKQMYSSSGINSLPIDVWIDRAGRVRRESIKVSAQQVSMDMTISFTRFGVPVDTTPPPADQVLDAAALLGAANGG